MVSFIAGSSPEGEQIIARSRPDGPCNRANLASKINAREYWFLEQKPPQYCHLKRNFMSRNNHLQALRDTSRFHSDVT